jgi:hypothetical protein
VYWLIKIAPSATNSDPDNVYSAENDGKPDIIIRDIIMSIMMPCCFNKCMLSLLNYAPFIIKENVSFLNKI